MNTETYEKASDILNEIEATQHNLGRIEKMRVQPSLSIGALGIKSKVGLDNDIATTALNQMEKRLQQRLKVLQHQFSEL